MDMQVAALDILTTKGGFAPAAARAIGEAMDLQIARSYDDLATNQKLDETRVLLESKIDGFRTELKSDIFKLDSKIDSVRVDLGSKIEQLRMELKADIAVVEAKLDGTRLKLEGAFATLEQSVRLQIAEAKAQFWHWMIWLMMGQTAALAGLMKLFMPHGP